MAVGTTLKINDQILSFKMQMISSLAVYCFASIILNARSLYLRLRHLGATVHLPSIQVITFVPSSTNPGSHAYCTVFPVSRPCPLVTWGIGGHGPVKQMYDI